MNNVQLNFNQLYYFHIIAEKGCLNDAAKFLRLSPSTMSEHLRGLEDRLSTKLFDREGRSLAINEVGRRVFKHTSSMFEISKNLLAELDDITADTTDYLDIGITPTISKLHTVQLLEPLFNQSDFEVRIRESTFGGLIRSLIAMDIGLILCNEPLPGKMGRNLISQSVESAPYVFVGGPKFRSLQENFPDNLNDVPFFNYTMDSNIRWQTDIYFKKHKLKLKRFGEADDVSVQRAAARSNMCIALLPEDLVTEHVQNGSLFVLGSSEEITTSVHAIYHRSIDDQLVKTAFNSIFKK